MIRFRNLHRRPHPPHLQKPQPLPHPSTSKHRQTQPPKRNPATSTRSPVHPPGCCPASPAPAPSSQDLSSSSYVPIAVPTSATEAPAQQPNHPPRTSALPRTTHPPTPPPP